MSRTVRRSLICLSLLAVVAGGASALVQQRADSPLAAKEFIAPEMEIVGAVTRVNDLPADSVVRLKASSSTFSASAFRV